MSRLGPDAIGTVAGRVATGTDLGNAVAWLMSPEAETVSGTIIDVGCFAHQGSSTPLKRTYSEEKING
jgi:enoyl-[acyl-carrier-protein] reductase (NADH)